MTALLHPLPPVGLWFVLLDGAYANRQLCLTSPVVYWKGLGPREPVIQAEDNIPYMAAITIREDGAVAERDLWWVEIRALHRSGWTPITTPPEVAGRKALKEARKVREAAANCKAREAAARAANKAAAARRRYCADRRSEFRDLERRRRDWAQEKREAAAQERRARELVLAVAQREAARVLRTREYMRARAAEQVALVAKLRAQERLLVEQIGPDIGCNSLTTV